MPVASVLHILRTIKDRGSIARTDLQRFSGLSWGTITNTTRELLDRKLIVEEGAASTRAGRKPMRLALNRAGQILIGVDISPDAVRCLTMNLAGETLGYEEGAGAAAEAPAQVLQGVAEMIKRALALPAAGRGCLGVGVALPGSLDRTQGVLRFAPRLPGWKDVPVGECLRKRVNGPSCEILLERNTNCLAIAERWFGEAAQAQHVLCVHLGEGVGMAVLLHGDIFRGSQELAGEFGHTTLDPEGPLCACGDRGCVEAYCSTSALLSYARSVAAGDDAVSKVRSIEELAALAGAKNSAALETFMRMGGKLGIGVANLIDLFNPELVVLAGRGTVAKDYFLPALEKALEAHVWRDSMRRLLVSRLGERATAMGACGMVLESVFEQPQEPSQDIGSVTDAR